MEAKAKRMRPLAECMVTFAKRGDLHARRPVLGRQAHHEVEAVDVVLREREDQRRPALASHGVEELAHGEERRPR